jgi:hypothetical protein
LLIVAVAILFGTIGYFGGRLAKCEISFHRILGKGKYSNSNVQKQWLIPTRSQHQVEHFKPFGLESKLLQNASGVTLSGMEGYISR